jgi:hypothetical protein
MMKCRNLHQKISLLVMAVLLCTVCLGAFAETYPQPVVDGKDSIVLVLVTDEGGVVMSHGSGFAIGKKGNPIDYIITNYHVVADSPESVGILVGRSNILPLEVIFSDPVIDYVILKASTPIHNKEPLALQTSENVKDGQAVYALGFPGESLDFTDYLEANPDDVTAFNGNISKFTTLNGVKFYQHSVPISPGSSGGPLLDESGSVIGINTLGFSDSAVKGSIYIDEILPGLDTLGIEYEVYAEPVAAPVEEPEPESLFSKTWFIILLVVVVLAGAGVAVVLVLNAKKKKTSTAQASPRAQAAPQGAEKPELFCVSGQFSSKSFGLAEGRLNIGRDPKRCNIIFSENTPGVSGKHCEVYYDRSTGKFNLTDSGSSYGTFLNSGDKLTSAQVYSLNAGDRFYLGNKDILFEVRMGR